MRFVLTRQCARPEARETEPTICWPMFSNEIPTEKRPGNLALFAICLEQRSKSIIASWTIIKCQDRLCWLASGEISFQILSENYLAVCLTNYYLPSDMMIKCDYNPKYSDGKIS